MKTFEERNVATALPVVVDYLVRYGAKEQTRNGPVYVAPTPVCMTYKRPNEMVLFNKYRDANPFFHLMEAVWMLSGNDDAKFLNYYVKDFGDRYGEDGILHGAYGHRWREHFGFDQLKSIIQKLRNDHQDRQCVLQMWDCTTLQSIPTEAAGMDDEIIGADDLNGIWKDRPCNTQVYFRINGSNGHLEMTTTARSHDALWGATGANAVHFPIMQQYVAGMVGVPAGMFYQFSNNYHLYESALETLDNRCPSIIRVGANWRQWTLLDNRYGKDENIVPFPLVTNRATFDDELYELMVALRDMQEDRVYTIKGTQENKFLWETVFIMALAHKYFKDKNYDEALKAVQYVRSTDWHIAGKEWLERRIK